MEEGRHYLAIRDDGCGFDTAEHDNDSSCGLSLIHGIAGSNGWDLRVDGSSGATAEVSFVLVLSVQEDGTEARYNGILPMVCQSC